MALKEKLEALYHLYAVLRWKLWRHGRGMRHSDEKESIRETHWVLHMKEEMLETKKKIKRLLEKAKKRKAQLQEQLAELKMKRQKAFSKLGPQQMDQIKKLERKFRQQYRILTAELNIINECLEYASKKSR
ncbi:MAG: hypothetical protein ABIE94_02830 [archaeon]